MPQFIPMKFEICEGEIEPRFPHPGDEYLSFDEAVRETLGTKMAKVEINLRRQWHAHFDHVLPEGAEVVDAMPKPDDDYVCGHCCYMFRLREMPRHQWEAHRSYEDDTPPTRWERFTWWMMRRAGNRLPAPRMPG